MADASRRSPGLTLTRVRRRLGRAVGTVKRVLRGDLDGLDRYMAVVLPCVFAAFYVVDKHPHRPLFYLLCLVPMLLYLRPSVIADVARLWVWRIAMWLCALWALSVAWSNTATVESAFDALRTAGALAIFLTACGALVVRGRFPDHRILWAVVVTAGACAVLTFALALLPGSEILADNKLRGFGWADHPGNAGDIYGFAAVVAVVFAVEHQQRSVKVGCWAVFGLCVVLVLLTESRAPLLGIVVAAAVLGVAKSARGLAAVLLGMAIAGLAAHFTGAVDFAHWIERGSGLRFALWADALDGLAAAPLVGAGAASTQHFLANGQTINSPHNGFIGMFFYLGALGGLPLLALCGHALWRATQHVLAGRTALFLVTLVFGLTVVFFHTKSLVVLLNRDWLIFWLPVILVTAVHLRACPKPAPTLGHGRARGAADTPSKAETA